MLKKNRRGDVASIIYVVIFLFAIGIILLLVSYINNEIYFELSENLNDTQLNTTQTDKVLSKVIHNNAVIWDYAFLGLFIGSLIAIGLSAYAIRISPVFYWVYGLLALVVLATGVMLSNIWQEMSVDPAFSTVIGNFPITDLILGTYFPMVVTAIVVFSMVIIFGKPLSIQQEGYY